MRLTPQGLVPDANTTGTSQRWIKDGCFAWVIIVIGKYKVVANAWNFWGSHLTEIVAPLRRVKQKKLPHDGGVESREARDGKTGLS